jgi:hypothetical protein
MTVSDTNLRTPTTSALSFSSEGLYRQFPLQYIDSGELQRMIGKVSLPYHNSFSPPISVEMESDFFDLILIGDTCARPNVREDDVSGDDENGDERT